MSPQPSQALQVSVFHHWRGKWSKNDGVFVFWHFVSPRPHQGWASQTSSVNLGFLPSVSLSAARLGGGRWALAENDPSGLIVFWPADWHWEEKQRHRERGRVGERGRERERERERERGGWVLMHLAAIREAYLTASTARKHAHTQAQKRYTHPPQKSTYCTVR